MSYFPRDNSDIVQKLNEVLVEQKINNKHLETLTETEYQERNIEN